MSESRDDSKMAPSTSASAPRSRGAGSGRGSSTSSKSSTSAKSKVSADKKRKQRKLPDSDQAGSKESLRPLEEAGGMPMGEPSAETSTPLEANVDAPTSAPQGRSRDASANVTPAKTPTLVPLGCSRDVSASVTPAKTPRSAPQGRLCDTSASVTPAKTPASAPLGRSRDVSASVTERPRSAPQTPRSAPQGRSCDASASVTPAKTPTSAPLGRSRDASASAIPAKTPRSASQGHSRDVSSSVTPAKTPTSDALALQREVTLGGEPTTKQPETPCEDVARDSVPRKTPARDQPIPPRDVASEPTPANTAKPSQPPGDDVHDLIGQVAAQPLESVAVPIVSKWSLRRPARRVFNVGHKYGKGKAGKFCKLLLLGAAVLAIGATLATYFSMHKTPPRTGVCTTVDCTKFGLELRAAINTTADPCIDFHSFVCGGWDDPNRQESTEAHMMATTADVAIAEMNGDKGQENKATQFFHSCIIAGTQRKENLQEFADLRRSIGLVWPEQKPNGSIHPVEVMVNLAINWEMNLLFDLSAVAVRESTALLFSRGRLDVGWERRAQHTWVLYEYEDYVKKYYGILGVSEERIDVQTAELLKMERAILLAKVAFLYDAPRQRWFKLSDLDSRTKMVSAALWLRFLAKHDKQFSWTANSTLIVEDTLIFQSIDKLMKEFNHDQLIIALSWMFIQSHLWAVCGEPSIRFHGPTEMVTKLGHRGCMEYVDSRLGLLGLPNAINLRYGASENRNNIGSFLYRINENIRHMVKNLTWMDENSKRMAYRKLENLIEVVMPNDSFFNRKNRDELYSVFPRMTGKTFVTNLVGASDVYRRLRSNPHFADVYSIRVYARFGREMYLYLPNLMKLAFIDLYPPLYFLNATLAILHGGLGSFAARQMVKSFDDIGVTVDHTGQSGIWLSSHTAAVHAEKVACNVRATSYGGEWRPMRLFPAVVALETAYRHYMTAVASDHLALDDYKVQHLETFTDKQVFFLTYCYAMCSKRQQTKGDECNVPLKNSRHFAEAFHCSEKAPMNPRGKCTFFDQ